MPKALSSEPFEDSGLSFDGARSRVPKWTRWVNVAWPGSSGYGGPLPSVGETPGLFLRDPPEREAVAFVHGEGVEEHVRLRPDPRLSRDPAGRVREGGLATHQEEGL